MCGFQERPAEVASTFHASKSEPGESGYEIVGSGQGDLWQAKGGRNQCAKGRLLPAWRCGKRRLRAAHHEAKRERVRSTLAPLGSASADVAFGQTADHLVCPQFCGFAW